MQSSPALSDMILKGYVLLLLVVAVCSNVAVHRRRKRTLSWLFQSDEPRKRLPIYKVHRYTGIHIQPVGPHHPTSHHKDVPEVEGSPPDVLEIPEDDTSSTGGLGSLISLIPTGSGLLSGALGLSGGSAGGSEDIKRIGKSTKKDLLWSLGSRKKGFVANVASGTLNRVISKGQATKDLLSGVIKGAAQYSPFTGGIYYHVPSVYPRHPGILSKIPIIGKLFGYGPTADIPDVYFPSLPQLVAVESPPDLPHISLSSHYELPFKTGSYVKVKVPKVGKYDLHSDSLEHGGVSFDNHAKPSVDVEKPNYDIPSTSYGVPETPVPVPEAPVYLPPTIEEEDFVNEVIPSSVAPEVVQDLATTTRPAETFPYPGALPIAADYIPPPPALPDVPEAPEAQFLFPYPPAPVDPYPSQQTFPYPPEEHPYPSEGYPYPPEGYPYPASGYYKSAGSEIHEVTIKPEGRPIYNHKLEPAEITPNSHKEEAEPTEASREVRSKAVQTPEQTVKEPVTEPAKKKGHQEEKKDDIDQR